MPPILTFQRHSDLRHFIIEISIVNLKIVNRQFVRIPSW